MDVKISRVYDEAKGRYVLNRGTDHSFFELSRLLTSTDYEESQGVLQQSEKEITMKFEKTIYREVTLPQLDDQMDNETWFKFLDERIKLVKGAFEENSYLSTAKKIIRSKFGEVEIERVFDAETGRGTGLDWKGLINHSRLLTDTISEDGYGVFSILNYGCFRFERANNTFVNPALPTLDLYTSNDQWFETVQKRVDIVNAAFDALIPKEKTVVYHVPG